MKYLKAYAKICLMNSEDNCDGCPFAVEETGCGSCLKYIVRNQEEAKEKIIEYVRKRRELKEGAA